MRSNYPWKGFIGGVITSISVFYYLVLPGQVIEDQLCVYGCVAGGGGGLVRLELYRGVVCVCVWGGGLSYTVVLLFISCGSVTMAVLIF